MEVSRRRMASAVIGYGAVSWGMIQVLSTVIPALSWPAYLLSWSIIAVAIVFPFYVILIWKQPDFLGFLSFEGDHERISSSEPDGINRILISRFKILRESTETDFLAFSLPEAITNALVGINRLSVQMDTDGISLNPNNLQLNEFVRTRKLNAILTGSILTVGNEVRVSASLVEQPSNSVIWTEATQSIIGNLLELQDKITQRIIQSLEVRLSPKEQGNLERKNTKNSEAYEIFLRANQVSLQAGNWAIARDMYISCLEKDPSFSPALARLGRCYRIIGKYSSHQDESIRNMAYSKANLEQALRLDPSSDLALNFLAQLDVDLGQPIEALKAVLARIEGRDSNANLYASLVHILRFCGLPDQSLLAYEKARAIDPAIITSVGQTYWMNGSYDLARQHLVGDIGFLEPVALAAVGDLDGAVAVITRNLSANTNLFIEAYLNSLKFAILGNKEECIANIEFATTPGIDGEALYHLVRCYGYIEEKDKALAGLRRVINKGYYQTDVYLKDPWLSCIRGTDEYRVLIADSKQHTENAERVLGNALRIEKPELLKSA